MAEPPLDARGYYDALEASFEVESEARRPYLDAIDSIVVERARGLGARTILDVGSGDGRRLAGILTRTGAAGVAVDVSPRMVAAAVAVGLEAHVMDISAGPSSGPLDGRHFDLVIALWNVLGHVASATDRERALASMRSLLSERGQVVLDVNNRHDAAAYGRRRALANTLRDVVPPGMAGDFIIRRQVAGREISTTSHLFSVGEIVRTCRRAGLEPIDVRFVDYDSGRVRRTRWGGQICIVAAPAA